MLQYVRSRFGQWRPVLVSLLTGAFLAAATTYGLCCYRYGPKPSGDFTLYRTWGSPHAVEEVVHTREGSRLPDWSTITVYVGGRVHSSLRLEDLDDDGVPDAWSVYLGDDLRTVYAIEDHDDDGKVDRQIVRIPASGARSWFAYEDKDLDGLFDEVYDGSESRKLRLKEEFRESQGKKADSNHF